MLVETQTVDRLVREQVDVPAELTTECTIGQRAINTYGEAVDVALEALDALGECNGRMTAIRGLNE